MQKVTVGMPLYNNARTLQRAVDSVLAQKGVELTLILSDDGSTDNTWQLCESYSANDERVKIVRQPKNLYYLNFLFVLQKSTTDYFCWLAGDDYLSETYLYKCITELEKSESLISCNSKCAFTTPTQHTHIAKGTYSIEQVEKTERLCAYLSLPADNSRMYGVFRRKILLRCFPNKIFHAYDWALSSLVLCYGKQKEIDEVLMFREKTPSSEYSKMVQKDHDFFLFRRFPVAYMSWYLIKQDAFPVNFRTLKALLKLNYNKSVEYRRNT
jgi:glycosyltransferase involved in cell wall biosynthesis